MMSTSFRIMTFVFTVLALFSYVASAPISARDVFVPPVLYPCAGTVWKAGETYTVTWDISNPPAQITNKVGKIVLSQGGILMNLTNPLASGFNIMLGKYPVTIPLGTTPGTDYAIVLIGDSGNSSPEFTITA